ncbi:MAG: hypothetical protein DDT40_01298 [candidate division WS2 bacterium]|nr:hypothetical protein [Candidatus Psychracetigena formicireducens]
MKAILFMVPKITRKKLAEELGISQDTLDTYIKEARRDGEL